MAQPKRKILDIETRKKKDMARQLAKPYASFDPDDVKTGNFGETAAKAKIEKARADHAEKEIKYYAGKEKHAGLVPECSEICTIGWIHEDDRLEIYDSKMSESQMLTATWDEFHRGTHIIGHTIIKFDLAMLIKRSWILGVKVPDGIYTMKGTRIYFTERIIDIATLWNLGESTWDLMKDGRQWSCSYIAKVLGCARPREYDVTGETFANFWDSPEKKDNDAAVEYLTDDLLETSCIYNKLYQ